MTRAAAGKSKRPPAAKPVDHPRGLRISTELTSWWYESMNARRRISENGGNAKNGRFSELGGAMQIKPKDVIDVLNNAGVRFVLMGAHAIAGWLRGEARSTMDVDVLVRKQHHKKAVQAVRDAFPHLAVEESPVVTRFRDAQIDVVVIDLMKPKHDIHAAVFENTVAGDNTYSIPNLEMALASKFAAMTSPNRAQPRKLTDAGDFGNMVLANRDKIDIEKLRKLAELTYPGGGDEAVALVDDFLAGRKIRL